MRIFISSVIALLFLIALQSYTLENRIVEGVVVNQKNEPLEDVHILVKGHSINTLTNTEGQFKINMPTAHNRLVVSHEGYHTKEIYVENEKLRIELIENVITNGIISSSKRNKKSERTIAFAEISERSSLPSYHMDIAMSMDGGARN